MHSHHGTFTTGVLRYRRKLLRFNRVLKLILQSTSTDQSWFLAGRLVFVESRVMIRHVELQPDYFTDFMVDTQRIYLSAQKLERRVSACKREI